MTMGEEIDVDKILQSLVDSGVIVRPTKKFFDEQTDVSGCPVPSEETQRERPFISTIRCGEQAVNHHLPSTINFGLQKHCKSCFNDNLICVRTTRKLSSEIKSSVCDRCGLRWNDLQLRVTKEEHQQDEKNKIIKNRVLQSLSEKKSLRYHEEELKKRAYRYYYFHHKKDPNKPVALRLSDLSPAQSKHMISVILRQDHVKTRGVQNSVALLASHKFQHKINKRAVKLLQQAKTQALKNTHKVTKRIGGKGAKPIKKKKNKKNKKNKGPVLPIRSFTKKAMKLEDPRTKYIDARPCLTVDSLIKSCLDEVEDSPRRLCELFPYQTAINIRRTITVRDQVHQNFSLDVKHSCAQYYISRYLCIFCQEPLETAYEDSSCEETFFKDSKTCTCVHEHSSDISIREMIAMELKDSPPPKRSQIVLIPVDEKEDNNTFFVLFKSAFYSSFVIHKKCCNMFLDKTKSKY